MKKIIPIVEGPGDIEAVPELLRRILFELLNTYDWQISRPKRANNLHHLKQQLDRFIAYACGEPDCGAILILLDLDDGCPRDEVIAMVKAIKSIYHNGIPIAIVFAYHEYEAWFLASLETIAGNYDLPAGLIYDNSPETIRGVKEWITSKMPAGVGYKETFHQVRMTELIDLRLAKNRSRSFARLCHAIEEIVDHYKENDFVSPIVS